VRPRESGRCRDCRHFDGSAEAVEAAFPGLTALSSGWASVRAEDGLCALLGLYLPGGDGCARQEPAVRRPERRAAA
jgi:hypothetical protein